MLMGSSLLKVFVEIFLDLIDWILSPEVAWLPPWLQQHDDDEPLDVQHVNVKFVINEEEKKKGFKKRVWVRGSPNLDEEMDRTQNGYGIKDRFLGFLSKFCVYE